MSSSRRIFPFYRVNADGRLTHGVVNENGDLPFRWIEINPNGKPAPTEAQLALPHCEPDLYGEPQIKERIRRFLKYFRDTWLSYWSLPLPTPFDPVREAENLNPLTQSVTRGFVDDIITYPRILLPSGFVQLGGAQFDGQPRSSKGKSHATQEPSTDKTNREALDLAVSLFKEHVRNVGRLCNCNCAAIEVLGRLDSLLDWMSGATGIADSDILNFIGQADLLDNALHTMSLAVAKTADHPVSAPSQSSPSPNSCSRTKSHRDRAEGCSNKEIAALFHSKCVRLIRKYNKATKEIIYEPRRGCNYYLVGTCCERTVRYWIKKFPTEKQPEPASGFHAGMLTDPTAIENAANTWGRYWAEYARQFTKWRMIHLDAPASRFRPNTAQIIHLKSLN